MKTKPFAKALASESSVEQTIERKNDWQQSVQFRCAMAQTTL